MAALLTLREDAAAPASAPGAGPVPASALPVAAAATSAAEAAKSLEVVDELYSLLQAEWDAELEEPGVGVAAETIGTQTPADWAVAAAPSPVPATAFLIADLSNGDAGAAAGRVVSAVPQLPPFEPRSTDDSEDAEDVDADVDAGSDVARAVARPKASTEDSTAGFMTGPSALAATAPAGALPVMRGGAGRGVAVGPAAALPPRPHTQALAFRPPTHPLSSAASSAAATLSAAPPSHSQQRPSTADPSLLASTTAMFDRMRDPAAGAAAAAAASATAILAVDPAAAEPGVVRAAVRNAVRTGITPAQMRPIPAAATTAAVAAAPATVHPGSADAGTKATTSPGAAGLPPSDGAPRPRRAAELTPEDLANACTGIQSVVRGFLVRRRLRRLFPTAVVRSPAHAAAVAQRAARAWDMGSGLGRPAIGALVSTSTSTSTSPGAALHVEPASKGSMTSLLAGAREGFWGLDALREAQREIAATAIARARAADASGSAAASPEATSLDAAGVSPAALEAMRRAGVARQERADAYLSGGRALRTVPVTDDGWGLPPALTWLPPERRDPADALAGGAAGAAGGDGQGRAKQKGQTGALEALYRPGHSIYVLRSPLAAVPAAATCAVNNGSGLQLSLFTLPFIPPSFADVINVTQVCIV